MKNALKISFVYIGLVIGAGFASGREILEYFNIPSQSSSSGIALATLAFGLLSYIIMTLAKRLEVTTFEDFVKSISPKLALPLKIFMYAFMFCGFFVMLSAAGTLFEDSLKLPFGLGVLSISIICFAVFSFDVRGLVAINTLMVPLMLAGTIFLCFSSILISAPAFSLFAKLKSNPLISSLCYVSYNTITAGAVLVPLSRNTDEKTLRQSSVISGSVLGVSIFLIWTAMNLYFDKLLSAEMPLLELAVQNGEVYHIIFAAVLFMALCTTAISQGFGLLAPLKLKKNCDRILASALLCLAAMPFARLGFSALVAKLYSAFGFLGLIWTGILIYRYICTRD